MGRPTKRSGAGGLRAWHWGVGLKAGKACRESPRESGVPPTGRSALVDRLRAAGGEVRWAGIKGVVFRESGALSTPWAAGTLTSDGGHFYIGRRALLHMA